MIPFEVTVAREGRLLTDWPMEDQQLRKLKSKLGMLESTDRDQAIGSILNHVKRVAEVYYIKINGTVALRPRCCVGHVDSERVTFLERVTKKDMVEAPSKKNSKAPERLAALRRGQIKDARITFHLRKRGG